MKTPEKMSLTLILYLILDNNPNKGVIMQTTILWGSGAVRAQFNPTNGIPCRHWQQTPYIIHTCRLFHPYLRSRGWASYSSSLIAKESAPEGDPTRHNRPHDSHDHQHQQDNMVDGSQEAQRCHWKLGAGHHQPWTALMMLMMMMMMKWAAEAKKHRVSLAVPSPFDVVEGPHQGCAVQAHAVLAMLGCCSGYSQSLCQDHLLGLQW